MQNLGLGRATLDYAERYAQIRQPALQSFSMYVLDVRQELLAYYQRQGYQITGHTEPYPVHAQVGQPLIPIQLLEMKKAIIKSS